MIHTLKQLDMNSDEKKNFEESSDFANYFCTYGYIYHQKQMLSDTLRMKCYYDAIFENISSFKDKIILDVGTGSGILSIWAAQAGAKKVYAVEATDMAKHAREIIKSNKLDHIITVIQSKMEDVMIPEKVDIIISEWMGYFLLRESMVDSVLIARNQWLKPGGALYPSHASIYLAGVYNETNCIRRYDEYKNGMDEWATFINNMKTNWHVDMSILSNDFRLEQEKYSLYTSQWTELTSSDVLSDISQVKKIDLHTITIDEIKNSCINLKFTLNMKHTSRIGGIAGWFDVEFNGSKENPSNKNIILTTSPYVEPTHWGQQVFTFHPPMQVCENDQINGTCSIIRRKDNQRLMNVRFEYALHRDGNDKNDIKNTVIYQIE